MSDEQTIVYIYFPGAKLKLAMTHTVFKKSPKSHTPLVFAKWDVFINFYTLWKEIFFENAKTGFRMMFWNKSH